MQIEAQNLKTGMSFKYRPRQQKNRIILRDPMELKNNQILLICYPEYASIKCHSQVVLEKNQLVTIPDND